MALNSILAESGSVAVMNFNRGDVGQITDISAKGQNSVDIPKVEPGSGDGDGDFVYIG